MRRYAAPPHGASKTQIIQNFRIIVGYPTAEYLPLPRVRWRLESLHLLQNLECPSLAKDLATGSHMLPSQQPAHELRRRHRLYLLSQRTQSQPVNPRQQPAVTPLRITWRRT